VAEVQLGSLDALSIEEAFPGVVRRRIDGEQCTVLPYAFEPGATHGLHSHAEEQVMIVQRGSLNLHLAGSTSVLGPGEYCVIPSQVEHGVTAGADGADLLVVIAPRRTGSYTTRPISTH
jgi:quercetin dioxygenase-like cupin family protein